MYSEESEPAYQVESYLQRDVMAGSSPLERHQSSLSDASSAVQPGLQQGEGKSLKQSFMVNIFFFNKVLGLGRQGVFWRHDYAPVRRFYISRDCSAVIHTCLFVVRWATSREFVFRQEVNKVLQIVVLRAFFVSQVVLHSNTKQDASSGNASRVPAPYLRKRSY